jgi:hypothetical protein
MFRLDGEQYSTMFFGEQTRKRFTVAVANMVSNEGTADAMMSW